MNYPFVSAEIRWFSNEDNLLKQLFVSLPEEGMGIRDEKRTDHYLKCGLLSTGVKVREGNHEIKVKSHSDDIIGIGRVEYWVKWSSAEEPDVLNKIDKAFLRDWVAVVKLRSQKNYEVTGPDSIRSVGDFFIDEGCGIEFTELYIPLIGKTIYTLGLEAFSQSGAEKANLRVALAQLEMDRFTFLRDLASYGYPELLSRMG